MLFQWFAGQLSDLRKTISEMGSLQREGDAVRLNRLPYDNNNNAINNNNNNNRIDDGKESTLSSPQKADSRQQQQQQQQQQQPADAASPVVNEIPSTALRRSDNVVLPIIVFCYNRAAYLNQTLTTLFKYRDVPSLHPIFVSQDGIDAATANTAKLFDLAGFFQRSDRSLPPLSKGPGENYYHIALHYRFALQRLFALPERYEGVIILEEDIDIAPDTLAYFRAMRRVMLRDPTIWTVSAWNDNGGAPMSTPDPKAVHRADFFPGLGWLLTAKLWTELQDKWPIAFWDDWLRDRQQRQGRASLRPELSRTHTFGAIGASGGQFYQSHLAGNLVSTGGVDWESMDLSYLEKTTYDMKLKLQLASAVRLNYVSQIDDPTYVNRTVVLIYRSDPEFVQLANSLQLMSDEKDGVFRTAYKGIVQFRRQHRLVFIAPESALNK